MPIERRKKPDVKGFTLIEVIITMAIASILTTIAIGGYLSWKPGYVFRGAVSQVRGDLQQAKMRAVETRRQCRVVFSTNGYQLEDGNRVMNSNAWGNLGANDVHTAGTPFRVINFNDLPQITLTAAGGAAIVAGTPIQPVVTFSPRGTAIVDSVWVVHPNAGKADIDVRITGNIDIEWL